MHKFLILLALVLVGCEDKVEVCSNDILTDKKELEEEFKNQNRERPDLAILESKLKDYLSKHKDEKCKIGESDFHPHKEINSLLSEIRSAKNKVRIKVIYGSDDRVDVVDHPNQEFKNYAHSVAALIEDRKISIEGILEGNSLGEEYNLCTNERFSEQKVIADCTGFLIDDDLLVTAGHCLDQNKNCNPAHSWAFGYSGNSYQLNPDDIYKCKEVVASAMDDYNELDYAVIKLDKKVEGRKPLKFRLSGEVNVNDNLVILGHPTGLPLKIADNASVRSSDHQNYFIANLDSFGGNSGSPVLNVNSGMVEGILVRGEQDYDSIADPSGNGFCRVVYQCADDECDGEESTRMSVVKGLDHYKLLGSKVDYQNLVMGIKKVESHYPLSVSSKKGFQYNLSMKKFLNTCITQIYDRYEGVWMVSSSFECSETNFEVAYQNYEDLGELR